MSRKVIPPYYIGNMECWRQKGNLEYIYTYTTQTVDESATTLLYWVHIIEIKREQQGVSSLFLGTCGLFLWQIRCKHGKSLDALHDVCIALYIIIALLWLHHKMNTAEICYQVPCLHCEYFQNPQISLKKSNCAMSLLLWIQ